MIYNTVLSQLLFFERFWNVLKIIFSKCVITIKKESDGYIVTSNDDGTPFNFKQMYLTSGGTGLKNISSRLKVIDAIFKQNEVLNNLKRIGKIELSEFEKILGYENQFFYRNKMEFSFSYS